MSKIYEKYRDLITNPFDIKYKNIEIKKIISYPPAGNDVVECLCKIGKDSRNVFIKIERSKVCDFATEIKNLNYLKNNGYYSKIPNIYESGIYNNKQYIVLSKIEGERLSDILIKNDNLRKELLYKYGQELATIHRIPISNQKIAKQRTINSYPNKTMYTTLSKENNLKEYIKFLEDNDFKKELTTFIHGDFHYANVLWLNNDINGVIDWEYSGIGLREQDIAWACTLRPGQKFMDTMEDIQTFLKGYSEKEKFDIEKLRWCLINSYCHFYLINENNEDYKNKLLILLRNCMEEKI